MPTATHSRPKGPDMGRGNKYDRLERKLWLLGARYSRKYGWAPFGGNGTTVNCVHCGTPLTLSTLEADRICPGKYGGRYTYDNVQPSCRRDNASRQARLMAEKVGA